MAKRVPGLPAGFVPCGPLSSAGSRVQVYLPHEWLSAREPGQWFILHRPERHRKRLNRREAMAILKTVVRRGIRTVIFQKVNDGRAPLLMAVLRLIGRRVIYVECNERRETGFTRHVDTLVAPSQRLADDLSARTGRPVLKIHDPIEYFDPSALRNKWVPKAAYRALWIGIAHNWPQVEALKAQLADQGVTGIELVTVSDHPDADLPWSLDTVRSQIERADLGIIPVTRDSWSTLKSHNRATLFMALGVPVVVSAGPVYEGLVRDGETGFVYASAADLKALPERLADADAVQAVRERAMAAAAEYSLDRIAPQWRELVVDGAPSAPSTIR